jgi:PhnB protein
LAVKPIPDGYHSVTPYLTVHGVAKLIDFMKQVFDGKEVERMPRPDGTIGHAEVRIGDSVVMMGEPMADQNPMPCTLYLYVPDTDAIYKRAMQAGATSLMEPKDQFYGDRNAGVQDASGNRWYIATRKEELTMEELQRRADAAFK